MEIKKLADGVKTNSDPAIARKVNFGDNKRVSSKGKLEDVKPLGPPIWEINASNVTPSPWEKEGKSPPPRSNDGDQD